MALVDNREDAMEDTTKDTMTFMEFMEGLTGVVTVLGGTAAIAGIAVLIFVLVNAPTPN